MKSRLPVTASILLYLAPITVMANVVTVGQWPDDLGETWQQREFEGDTRYRATDDDSGILAASANGTASALYREVEIDLRQTPWLQWSWRVDRLPSIDAPETDKAGDDYGARVYVVKEGFFGKLSARALNYVWSQVQPAGSRWPNAFTGRAILWSVQHGEARTGEWITYTRNIRADWQTAFGEDIETLDGIALMTDADNSASRSAARYGTLRFCATKRCGDE